MWQIAGTFESSGMIPTFAATQSLLLDTYPNAAFAYSFRKLRAAYAGSAVRIRRSSDNAELDIGFDAEGDFDTSAAATHIGAGTGYIVTWYDQSGNGLDVTQATAGNQPQYSATAMNSLPGMVMNGSAWLVKSTVSLSSYISTNVTIFAVLKQDGSRASNTLYTWEQNNPNNRFISFVTLSDTIYFDFGDNSSDGRVTVSQPTGWDDANHIYEAYRDTLDNQAIVVDGSSLASGTRTVDVGAGTADFIVGDYAQNGSLAFSGVLEELISWGTDLG